MKQTIGIFILLLSVFGGLGLFVFGVSTTNSLAAQGYPEDQVGLFALATIGGSLVVGCFGFFLGLFLINPWAPAAYIAFKYYREHQRDRV